MLSQTFVLLNHLSQIDVVIDYFSPIESHSNNRFYFSFLICHYFYSWEKKIAINFHTVNCLLPKNENKNTCHKFSKRKLFSMLLKNSIINLLRKNERNSPSQTGGPGGQSPSLS